MSTPPKGLLAALSISAFVAILVVLFFIEPRETAVAITAHVSTVALMFLATYFLRGSGSGGIGWTRVIIFLVVCFVALAATRFVIPPATRPVVMVIAPVKAFASQPFYAELVEELATRAQYEHFDTVLRLPSVDQGATSMSS